MSIKLVWITPNAEEVISYCARVSNAKNQDNKQTAPKLLKYCLDHKHFSIFEMASVCVEINTTRTIARQILRHRSFSFQEFSGRYSEMPEQPVISVARRQDTKNRQNSIDDCDLFAKELWKGAQQEVWDKAYENYKWALEFGYAKEVARNLLPEGMVQSRMYMTGTVRSFLHFLDVRWKGEGVQKECRDVAADIAEVLRAELPVIFEAKEW